MGKSEAFHCPKDHGVKVPLTIAQNTVYWAKPTCYETLGCSYVYNIEKPPSFATVFPLADAEGLAAKIKLMGAATVEIHFDARTARRDDGLLQGCRRRTPQSK